MMNYDFYQLITNEIIASHKYNYLWEAIIIYTYYKIARNRSWITIIECGTSSLPVKVSDIAKYYNIKITPYSKSEYLNPRSVSEDGYISLVENSKVIYFNDTDKPLNRQRFTIGHELGHARLNHPLDCITARTPEQDGKDHKEVQANVFSRDILMPACVLNAIGAFEPAQISNICNISIESATIRADRLAILRVRNKFGMSPLERKVLEQFQEYIKHNKLF